MKPVQIMLLAALPLGAAAQAGSDLLDDNRITITWPLESHTDITPVTITGSKAQYITASIATGQHLSAVATLVNANAAEGYTGVTYAHPFASFVSDTRVGQKTDGYNITATAQLASGHTFRVTGISLAAVKVGTDGGNFDVTLTCNGKERGVEATIAPLRNKVQDGNPNGFSTHQWDITKTLVEDGQALAVSLYPYNFNGQDNANPKQIGFNQLTITGYIDTALPEAETAVPNGGPYKRDPRPAATPLNRGLMAVKTADGILVSWRIRESDGRGARYYLYRGKTMLNSRKPIIGKSNFLDTGNTSTPYTLVVCNADGKEIDRQENVEPWASNALVIPTSTPTDKRGTGATYTPNDCGMEDMDGDGEYEIIVKWDPSNSKDAAASGVTGSTYLDCYKLNGKQLWRIDLGQNIRSGAHTTPFVCADFDGDGYGELMVKTAPGTIDGAGQWVVLGDDDPAVSHLNGRGKVDSGPEYITIFDGLNGKQIHTLPYHTDYAAGASYWGDSNQNRSDRYLACPARLDGIKTSGVFNRGYYAGAFVGAYDFDGTELSLRWLHRSISSGKDLWGEGAHNLISGDVDGDGRDEIIFGSAALDDNGKILYRTGLGHGDASHVTDIDLDNPGMEVFMVHEKSPYGFDLHDARTGKILLHQTADGDTGRGLMADFDENNPGGEMMASCSGAMFNSKGKEITQWKQGTVNSSGLNFRIYWDGDLMDEYMDRSHIDKWDSDAHSFGRLITLWNNGSTSINSTKENPNLQADILGDWREEVVYYNATDNSLIITATDHQSPYPVPFLMDNHHYALAIGWQNCAYNQPPHMDCNLVERYTIKATCTLPDINNKHLAWTTLSAPYPCRLELGEGCTANIVRGIDHEADTVKLGEKKIGTPVPAGTSLLISGPKGAVSRLVPTAKATTALTGANYLKSAVADSLLVTNDDTHTHYWQLRDGDLGTGFYRCDGTVAPVGTAWMYLKASATTAVRDYYSIGTNDAVPIATPQAATDVRYDVFTLSGARVATALTRQQATALPAATYILHAPDGTAEKLVVK